MAKRPQRHEVETWVNPSAWDDPAEAEAVVDAIMGSGSLSEEEWVRIAGGNAQHVEDAAARDATRQWTTPDVAAYLGVGDSTVSAYRSRRQMPAPDGQVGRTPWWWEATIRAWRPQG